MPGLGSKALGPECPVESPSPMSALAGTMAASVPLGKAPGWRVPLARPDLDEADRRAVMAVLDSPFLSLGPQLSAFEAAFEALMHGAPSSAVSSGTAGLFLALRALGVDGGEVLTPSFGFIGTAHAIRLAGAQPRFVDVDRDSLCVTPETLERACTPDCRAVVPVDIFGTPAPIPAIVEWARARGMPVVEDACEALGATVGSRPVGALGADASVFAFYPNKQVTCGEGGMVVTPDPELAARIRSSRNQGRGEGFFDFIGEGFNFRLTELQAALGRSQLSRLPQILATRERVAERYHERLPACPGLRGLSPPPVGSRRSWFVFPVFVEDPAARAPVRAALHAAAIQTAPYFPPIHSFAPFAAPALRPDDLPVTEAVACRSFAIPFHNRLTEAEQDEVVGIMARVLAGR